MSSTKSVLIKLLEEIRTDCTFAALPEDINLNLVIEGIDRLAAGCIAVLSAGEP